MGVDYLVYAEVNVDGKWYSLCPQYKMNDGSLVTGPLYYCSSSFTPVHYELQSNSIFHGIPDDMSEDLKKLLRVDADFGGTCYGAKTWREYYQRIMYCVNFAQAIVPCVVKENPFKYEGYVLKEEMAAFECHETDEFSEWLTEKEYTELDKKEKRMYAFYRWNEPNGTFWFYNKIAQRIWALCELFEDICGNEIGGSLYKGITDSQVRVFIEVEN